MKNKDTFFYNTFNWNIQIPKDDMSHNGVFKITKSIILNFVHFR